MTAGLTRWTALVLLAAIGSGCASSANIQPVADQPVIEVQAAEQTRPIQFRKIVIKLKRGEDIGAIEAGLLCAPHAELTFRGGRMTLDSEELTETFQHELEVANYQVVGDPDALFEDPSAWKAEYLVAGLVKRMNANICYPMLGWGSTDAKGEAFMEVQWQIYSRLDRKVVYELTTQGSSDVADSRPTGEVDVFLDAFAQATRNLLADEGFHDLIAGGGAPLARSTSTVAAPSAFVPRGLFTQAIGSNMETVRSNVVVVYAGGGHGSGFVIDDDGHLLTNEHVVRAAERVTVRFESGGEATATVLAVDARRDVALLRVDRGGTGGLPIRFDAPAIGAEVYAVGAPLDPSYSATVSRGIVSALRTIDGETWIQSDVNVQPGNSGGPLLDDRGNIIGITSRGEPTDAGTPSGINFFVPITDALTRLGLSPKGAAS
jgi:S1-C subfamily serine protease